MLKYHALNCFIYVTVFKFYSTEMLLYLNFDKKQITPMYWIW